MLRAHGPGPAPDVPLDPGERVLASLDGARLSGLGDGAFVVTTRAAKFVATPGLAGRALHALGAGAGGRGETHAVPRAEILSVDRESTALGFNRLRLRLRGGTEWLVDVGARDPSALLLALRARHAE